MKRIFLFLTLWTVTSLVAMGAEDTPAILATKAGKALRVFLMSTDGASVETEFQKLRQKKSFTVKEIDMIRFTPPGLDENELIELEKTAQKLFQQADYEQLIAQVDPVTAPYGQYMSVSNNLQAVYGLLMRAYSRSGQHAQAAVAAENLIGTQDASLKLNALVCAALAAADRQDFAAAKAFKDQIKDPAAALYAQVAIERAEGASRDAIQTAVKVIAHHTDSRDWLPPTEILCAELYLDMGRTNSAEVTARQSAKMYAGTNIGEEANALRSRIEQLMEQSEKSE